MGTTGKTWVRTGGRESTMSEADRALRRERARLAKEQADAASMANDVRRGKLVPVDGVSDWMVRRITAAKMRLLALPTKLAPRVVACKSRAEIEGLLENEILEALAELSADPSGYRRAIRKTR